MSARTPLPNALFDAGIALLALVLVELASWADKPAIGDPIAGPTWLVAALPLCWALPLYWRRTHALLVLCVVMAGVVLQALVSWHSPEGLEMMAVVGAAVYSSGAYTTRRNGWIALAVALVGYGIYAAGDPNIRSGRSSDMWAGAFFLVGVLACWMIGTLLRQHRERLQLAARADALEATAATAVADERARLARDLHDIVSHNLSVMVVQAAGARARGSDDAGTLEKIERSGRASLVEMRRLLGVLRADEEQATLVPQPGIADLDDLVAHVRDSGIPVELTVSAPRQGLPAAIELSVYRIVQEALTNVVKHAGQARAEVTVAATQDAVRVEVRDDGRTPPGATDAPGHGLVGMRERVALLHGEVSAGRTPDGGFRVRATLPLTAGT